MANNRVFLAQGLTTNGIAVGGLAEISVDAGYQNIIRSSPDGAVGTEDVDRAGLAVDVSLSGTDVTKGNAILAAAVGDTEFYGKESGAATWQKRTMPGVLWHSLDLDLPQTADGSMSLRGAIRFAEGTTTLAQVIAATGEQTQQPVITYPARLFRPHNAIFDPGSEIPPKNLVSVRLALAVEQLLQDFGDDDLGMTAVDITGWNDLQVTLVHKDASEINGRDRATQLIEAGRGILTVTLMGRGGAANKTLTINNLQWTRGSGRKAKDYWEFTMTGSASWRKPDGTGYTLNSTDKLFAIA